jgi:preprotein translocase subunit YajC
MMDGLLLPILMFGALGLMMVFGMRKQKRQAAEAQKMQDTVVPGARIMTTSGLHGTVTAVADDTIELEISPGVYTTWARAAVRQVIVPVPDPEEFGAGEFDAEDSADASRDGDESRQTDVG